jgi:hypothetical protein
MQQLNECGDPARCPEGQPDAEEREHSPQPLWAEVDDQEIAEVLDPRPREWRRHVHFGLS